MPEVAEVVQTTETPAAVTQPTAAEMQIQELERMAFGGEKPTEQQSAIETPAATTETTAATTTTASDDVIDADTYFKNEFGWENAEIAKQEIAKLRATPQPEFKFENDDSRKMAEAVSKGDRKTVLDILQKQERIETLVSAEVTKETAPDIIKLGLQLKYPTLTQDQINFQYKQDYGIPKEPVMKETEDEEDFKEIHSEWKEKVSNIEMKAMIAATMAKPEIETAKAKIVLPDIQSPTTVDKDFEAYKASNANADKFYNEAAPLIMALKESDVPLKVSINDANNKMQFDINIVPETADFEAARQDSLAWNVLKGVNDKDGKFVPQNLQRAALILNNFDKYMQSAARQAVNAERKRVIEEETKGGGIQRDFNTIVEPTELQKLEKMAFG